MEEGEIADKSEKGRNMEKGSLHDKPAKVDVNDQRPLLSSRRNKLSQR